MRWVWAILVGACLPGCGAKWGGSPTHQPVEHLSQDMSAVKVAVEELSTEMAAVIKGVEVTMTGVEYTQHKVTTYGSDVRSLQTMQISNVVIILAILAVWIVFRLVKRNGHRQKKESCNA